MKYAAIIVVIFTGAAFARDDGRYALHPLKNWFDSLHSNKGHCCSDADAKETEYDIR